jgi:hypothetical protein
MVAATGRRRWAIAVTGGLVLIGLFVALFRAPEGRDVGPAPAAPVPGVRLVNLRKNEAALTDPTPLFLPTEWNAGQDPLESTARREAGSSFAGYPPKLKFAASELGLVFPPDVVVPERPVDALGAGHPGPTFLGRRPDGASLPSLPSRRGFVEITATGSGQRVLAQPLTDAEPPAPGWQPLEFLVAVDPMGMVGPPIMTESSRVVAVDVYFRNYLVKTLHVGERLPPGFYRVCVGP